MPNSIECVVALLACGAIGAIFSSTSPDMGAAGIVDRYIQMRPKALFFTTAIHYAGKDIDLRGRMKEVVEKLEYAVPELTTSVIVSGGPISEKTV